jgi:hypothetical protein
MQTIVFLFLNVNNVCGLYILTYNDFQQEKNVREMP